MITEINESKTLTKDISWNVNVNLMKQNAIQVNGGITNVDVSVKNRYVKNIIFGILVNVVLKTENIQQVLWMIQRLPVIKL